MKTKTKTKGFNKAKKLNSKKLNFALIGCGKIVNKHIAALEKIPNVSLIAVCDLDEKKAKEVAKKLKISFYNDYKKMLEKEKNIDVVCILTPSGTHAEVAINVAKYRKHIVVEKPMALKLEDADDMIRACDENDVKLFVVKQNRYNQAIRHLRKAVKEGKFGKLLHGTIRVRWCRKQDYYDEADWRGTWWGDGGVFTNQASHHIDLLEWMMGDVESVMCMTKTHLADIETEDTGVAILRFTNGALGIIEATTATRPSDLEGSISVLGEKGSVVVGGFAANQILTWKFENELEHESKILDDYKNLPKSVYYQNHYEYLKDVVDCILNNKQALVDGLEGRKSLELINALYESAETGKEVFLRFKPKMSRLGKKQE
ncbi:Gfo/Idh/MocA family oxidoreductase [Candidatus Woesearchaeota archaeon]|nr:Gfo/Idh/MocA family oxidoreductase [Candidatus Woesearchaeota archaeon]